MRSVHLDCCRSFPTGPFVFQGLLCHPLSTQKMREKTLTRACHCFAYNLPVSSHYTRGENPISYPGMQAMHFPTLVQLSNLVLCFSLVYLFLTLLALAKLIPTSRSSPTCSHKLARSSLKLVCCHSVLNLSVTSLA